MSVNEKSVDFDLVFEPDGTITDPWWSKESYKLVKAMGGKPLRDYETVAANPYCG
jgi:hypothetical protein